MTHKITPNKPHTSPTKERHNTTPYQTTKSNTFDEELLSSEISIGPTVILKDNPAAFIKNIENLILEGVI